VEELGHQQRAHVGRFLVLLVVAPREGQQVISSD
jgi:hypothetical protein